MKNIFLILSLFISVQLLQAQNGDILDDRTFPSRHFFNRIKQYEWDELKQDWVFKKGINKIKCNYIYFNYPRSVNVAKYYDDNHNLEDMSANERLLYELNDDPGAWYYVHQFSNYTKKDAKHLRINNYKNTQSSLELNTTDNSFSGIGYLDTGEECYIFYKKDTYFNIVKLSIIVGDIRVVYEKAEL